MKADTIFSLWMPLKMTLESLNPHKKFYKYDKCGNINDSSLKDIINNIDTYLPRDNDLVEKIYEFAELAQTRANVMRLQDQKMQDRGKLFYDQMLPTLFNCFEGGKFYEYFNCSVERVVKWIKVEKLEMFFDGEISKENIKPLIPRLKASESKWLTEKEDIIAILKQYNEILVLRRKALSLK